MNKNTSLIILIALFVVITGLILLNRDQFKTPLQQQENKTTQTEPVATPTPLAPTVAPTNEPIDLVQEVKDLDAGVKSLNTEEFSTEDLQDSALGL